MANQPPQPAKNSGQQEPAPSPWREFILWILIVIFFTVWYVVVLWPKAHPEVNIPYTAFVAQVRSGNVANVHIVGDEITGSFVKPVVWPAARQPNAGRP